eukprot:CCRYP_010912-RA/>CCRYP_010912-RA protein AED:0.31 eAED:0.31 QI:0/-1/0/1/-1/1/1/0/209
MGPLTSAEKKNAGFLDMIGLRIEKFIDSIPILGVPTPVQPWNPLTDTKAALLSDPIVVLTTFLKWDFIARLLEKNTLYLFDSSKGTTDAPTVENHRKCDLVMEEEPLLAQEDSPIFVTSDDASVERSVASFAEMTTSDESYLECPSVMTEGPAQESFGASEHMKDFQVDATRENHDSDDDMMTDDENEYVLAEEPRLDDEDFVNVGDKA